MADNTRLNPGSGGDLIADDDIGGVKHQEVLIEFGSTGEAIRVDKDIGLPVNILPQTDNPIIDPYGRLRTSQPVSLAEFTQTHGLHNALVWASASVGNGGTVVHHTNRASTILTVDSVSGSGLIYQTKRYFKYDPGLGLLLNLTGILVKDNLNEPVRRRYGYFDAANGIFFQNEGGVSSWVLRNSTAGPSSSGSVSELIVTQANWNMDKLDGTGSSSITLDPTKAQIFVIDYQWMGVGRVRVGFEFGGKYVYAHEFIHTNNSDVVYMATPNLPFRGEITNISGTVGSSSLEQMCYSISTEGGFSDKLGIARSANMGITPRNVGVERTPLISFRLQESASHSTIADLSTEIVSLTSTNFLWEAVLNPTIPDSASWTPVSDSVIEIDTARSGTVVGGTTLASGYGAAAGQKAGSPVESIILPIQSMLGFGSDVLGNRDEIVITAQNTVGTDNFLASIEWQEAL